MLRVMRKKETVIDYANITFTYEIKASKARCFVYANIENLDGVNAMVYIRTSDGRAFWIEVNELQKIETKNRPSGFKQAFSFPSDIFRFGKHNGKQIDFVIDNDRTYYNWLLSEGLRVTEMIQDYAKGLDVATESITYQVNKKTDTLTIRSVKHYILPKLKFIRGKDFRKHISDNVIAEYKIEIPFTETTSERTEYRDYTKFHCDCEEVTVIATTKTYDEFAFRKFLEEKLNLHKIKQ